MATATDRDAFERWEKENAQAALRPQPQLAVTVQRDGAARTLEISARITKRRARLDLDNQLDRYVAEMQEVAALMARGFEAFIVKRKQS